MHVLQTEHIVRTYIFLSSCLSLQHTALRTVFRFHTHKRGSCIERAVLKLFVV